MPKLTYVVGSGGETRSVDVGDSCSIGSLPGNTIVLDAALGVSRRHSQILKIATGYEIADLGSTNGTKVNGSVVKKHKLAGGDKVEIGKVTLTFDDGTGAAVEEEISLEEPAGAPAPAKASAGGGGASDQCMIVFAGGDKDGQKVQLDKPRVTFGRNPKNVVQLNDAGMSGFHAEIAREDGAYVLRDLGSTNGTLIDGEPVSETALQHGARIRMGNTRFVFVDPTVSDFEKAMAAVDDLGSEWGMLRAEMDMTRVQEARRSQIVTTIVLLVVVIGGGAFVYMNRDKIAGGEPPLERVAGNKVEDFSFEQDQNKGWIARPGSPSKAPSAGDPKSDGKARQGKAFLAVTRNGAGGACAAAQSTASYTVSPGSPVEFGARVRAGGGAIGGVRISWLDKPEGGHEIRRSSSPLTASTEWYEVKGVATPPEGSRAAKIELINAASGTAYFDDVFFVPGAGGAVGGSSTDGKVSLSATGDAQTTISRDGTKILIDGAVVGGALRADAIDDPSRRGDRSGSQSLSGGAGLTADGNLVDPTTGQMVAFKVGLVADKGRFVELKGQFGNTDAAWVATLPEEFVTAGIGVRVEGGEYRRATDPHLFEKVQDVSFGGARRFKVSRGADCGTLRMALYRVGETWEVGFGVSDGKLSVQIDTDTAALTADIDKLKDESSIAMQQKKYGAAISKLKELGGFHPAGSAEAAAVEETLKKLEEDGASRLATLANRVTGAVQFRDASDLRSSMKAAKQLAGEFEGHPVGAEAAALAKKCEDALTAIDLAIAERLARPLERKADDFMNLKVDGKPMATMAEAFYNEIVVRFPDTEAAKRARAKLDGLRKK
jgi:pSer/pThr/pTyr-binding forkhead associated (FHA) protein